MVKLETERELPESEHVEIAVLGTMLLDDVAIGDATAQLTDDDFLLDSHRRIYRVIVDLRAAGRGADRLSVETELRRRKELDTVGGMAYLHFLTEGIPQNFNIESYVLIVQEKSLLRRGLSILRDATNRCYDASEDAALILGETAAELGQAVDGVRRDATLESQADAEFERIERQAMGQQRVFVTSGLASLDFSHGGYALRETTVLAARPKVGKSTFLRQGVMANCEAGDHVHLFTPEMPAGQVLRCIWAVLAKVPFSRVRRPEQMTESDMAKLRDAKKAVAQWPLKIDDTSPIYGEQVIARARAELRKHSTKLIGLDYLQKLKYKGRAQDRHIEVTDTMVGLTSLAKNEDVALVVVSSLTEPGGRDKNRIPSADDLRQSGDIKFEANTVLVLHREMEPDTQKLVPETMLIVGLSRSDTDGSRKIYHDGSLLRFIDQEEFLRGQR